MSTKRRNFWVLLTLAALLITGTRWLSRHQPVTLSCHAEPVQIEWAEPQAYPAPKAERRCGKRSAKTPAFDAFVRVDREPVVLNQDAVRRQRTPQLMESGLYGTATARILVDEHGNYVRHQVIHLSHPALRPYCNDEAAKLTFTPAIRHGRAVRYWVNVPFTFGGDIKGTVKRFSGTCSGR